MSNMGERRRKPGQKRREKTSIDGGYSDPETREHQNIQSSHMTDKNGQSLVSEAAGEYFKHRCANISLNNETNERILWLDRMADVNPLFDTDRQALLQMIDDLGIYLAATVFNNAPQMWEKTYLNGMLASLRHNIELLEIGAYPPVFYPSNSRPTAIDTHQAFKQEVRVALGYFIDASSTKRAAYKAIAETLKKWEVKGFAYDTVKRIKPERSLGAIQQSLFIQLVQADIKISSHLENEHVPKLKFALGMMADAYKRRRAAINEGKESARGSRYNRENLRAFKERHKPTSP